MHHPSVELLYMRLGGASMQAHTKLGRHRRNYAKFGRRHPTFGLSRRSRARFGPKAADLAEHAPTWVDTALIWSKQVTCDGGCAKLSRTPSHSLAATKTLVDTVKATLKLSRNHQSFGRNRRNRARFGRNRAKVVRDAPKLVETSLISVDLANIRSHSNLDRDVHLSSNPHILGRNHTTFGGSNWAMSS